MEVSKCYHSLELCKVINLVLCIVFILYTIRELLLVANVNCYHGIQADYSPHDMLNSLVVSVSVR